MRAQETYLSNGLRVVHLENPANAVINMQLSVAVGGQDDPKGKLGLSHALEHCILMETQNMRGNTYQQKLHALGGHSNAMTSAYQTIYPFHARAENDNLFELSDLIRQLMTEPYFDPARVQTELRVIRNELYDYLDDQERQEHLTFNHSQLSANSYKGAILGAEDEFSSITPEDFHRFITRYYRANSMCLYVVSPYPADKLIPTLENTLSAIPSGGNTFTARQDRYEYSDHRQTLQSRHQNRYRLMFDLPNNGSLKQFKDHDISSNTIATLLPWSLREQTGCAYTIKFSGYGINKTQINTLFELHQRPDQTQDFLNAFYHFAAMIDKLPEEALLNERNNAIHNAGIAARQTDMDVGSLEFFDQYFDTMYDSELELETLEAITSEDIRKSMKQTIASLAGVSAIGPEPAQLPSLDVLQQELKAATGLDDKMAPVTSLKAGPGRPRM